VIEYPTLLDTFDVGKWGTCRFLNWTHPQEGKKEFTEQQIDWLAQFIEPGTSCVDIGAYTGDTALPMSVASGPAGEVIAFEPNPVTHAILVKNSKLNPQYARIKCRKCAIAESNRTAIFHYDATGMNGGFLIKEPVHIVVKVERLDRCVFRRRLAFAKIDAEGEDGSILWNNMKLFKGNKTVVQVERYPHLNSEQATDLWRAISAYGTPFIEHDWERTPLTTLPPGLCNIVITPHA
jgi:FkbM family methyltransferase